MSITIHDMKWSNLFSYGEDNYINFIENPLTQLVGANGHGKSSIPLVLELGLFNKNSKGIKSGDILNRHSAKPYYTIEITFSKGEDIYRINVKRASTQTVKLTHNNTDISAHTATATFALIEDVLGFDHKTFCQLFYQSSAQSLEFLTATDTNRKKFLIDFLELDRYIKAGQVFDALAKAEQKVIAKQEAAVATIVAWLEKQKHADLTVKELMPELPQPTDARSEAAKLKEDISRITETNKAVLTNNKYKELLDSIDLSSIDTSITHIDPTPLSIERAQYERTYKEATSFITHVKSLKSVCPTCSHPIDNSKQLELVGAKEIEAEEASAKVKNIASELLKISENNKIVSQNASKQSQWEQYHSLYDASVKPEILDKNNLEAMLLQIESEIKKAEKTIADITKANNDIFAHNSKVQVITTQIAEMQVDLGKAKNELDSAISKLSKLSILVKSFGTNGLPAYKIESMIKDLEVEVNTYLAELSYGRFQISFVISGEKLDVVISDNGSSVSMSALSSGERARINTATLLAIRKIMQQISKVKVNLLVLDETLENLDAEGKEKLIEILLSETYLNVILISHSFSHPLIYKINVIKENNISRLE
jgi:DNA repair exonuclease SbcCD ATPase subunit